MLKLILGILSAYILFNLVLLIYHYINDLFVKEKSINRSWNPKISVLIPAHNEQAVISKTIKSIKDSNYKNIEIIVIAHNCNDNTYQEAKKQNVKVLNTNIGKTKGDALNYGFKRVTGDVICVIDSDSIIPSTYFDIAISELRGHDALQTEVQIYNAEDSFLSKMTSVEFQIHAATHQFLKNKWDMALLGGNGQFIKRNVFKKIGTWSNNLADDTEISMRMLSEGFKIAFTDKTHVKQEAVTDFKSFIKQRTRWSQGNASLIKESLKIKHKNRLQVFFSVNGILFSPFIKLSNIIFIIGFMMGEGISDIFLLLVAPYILFLILAMLKQKIYILCVIPFYLYTQLNFIVHFNAIYNIIRRKNEWVKTIHVGK